MNNDIEAIKQRVSIGSLLGTHKKTIQCPVPEHQDKRPSCNVDHERGLWHCFPCGVGGDIFSLVMHRDRRTFTEALEELAGIAGVTLEKPQEAKVSWERQQRISKALSYATDYYHRVLMDSVGGKAWLASRGFSLETAQNLKLGLADGNLVQAVQAQDSLALADFADAGLIIQDGRNPRDYFRDRIIFPAMIRERVLNLSGRALSGDMKPKYLHLANLPTDYFYNEDALGETVWLFEGHPDTVSGVQAGLPAVGVVGTSGMIHPEKVARAETVYICGDADAAGKNAAEKWAADILKQNSACNIMFVTLPEGCKDFNEWYVKNQGSIAASSLALEESAQGLIDYKISTLSSTDELVKVWPLLEPLPEINRDGYLRKIKLVLKGCSLSILRSNYKDWQAGRKANALANSQSSMREIKFERIGTVNRANIDFRLHPTPVANVCLYANVTREVDGTNHTTYEPVIIRSTITGSGESYQAETLSLGDAFGFDEGSVPLTSVVEGRWKDASIQTFLQGKAQADNTAQLVRDMAGYFRRYIWHREPITHEILALYAIGTYAARLFGAYPYLSLNGLAGSGKSNCLDLLQQVCFNSIFTANISPASLFRSIEKSFPTCIRDEAEQFNKRTPENMDELTMLNAGYKSGAKVIRTEKNGAGLLEPEEFDLFSPKIFAGINMLNDTLLTRSILIKMYKAPKDVIKGMPKMVQCRATWEAEGAALRDRIYTWVLSKFHLLAQVFQEYVPVDEIANRDWEVWLPLLSIAGLSDLEDEQRQDGEDLLTMRIIQAAIKKGEERKGMVQDNAIELKVLQTILVLLEEKIITSMWGHKDWYSLRSLSKAISERLVEDGYFKDGKEVNVRWLVRILDQTQVITDRKTQIKDVKEGGKKLDCVYMTKEVLESAVFSL